MDSLGFAEKLAEMLTDPDPNNFMNQIRKEGSAMARSIIGLPDNADDTSLAMIEETVQEISDVLFPVMVKVATDLIDGDINIGGRHFLEVMSGLYFMAFVTTKINETDNIVGRLQKD